VAIVTIPVQNGLAAQRFRVDLDTVTFELKFTFNTRKQRWTFDIFAEDGTELLNGIPILVKQFFLDKYQHDQRLPQGDLFAQNIVNEDEAPTFENLGTDVVMLYQEAT